jgi:hypothetical protein
MVLGALGVFSAILLAGAAEPRVSVRWIAETSHTSKVAVEVSGLTGAALRELRQSNWQPEQWQRLLAVYAEQGDLRADLGLPPMLGAYRLESNVLRFEPRFALEPGVSYRAVLRPNHLPDKSVSAQAPITAVFQLPRRSSAPATVVTCIYPSADVLPENLLKFYIHFSAPMSRGHIYDYIHLQDSTGSDIELPFLEIDEELWDGAMTRLTLFIDPGRIKRGVRPLEEVGPALETGKRYTLVIDRDWHDASGSPLKEPFAKKFQVGPPDRQPPDPEDWKIHSPKSKTREPLLVTFPEPMDHALAQRVIQVSDPSGETVEGKTDLKDHERRWSFVPTHPWGSGHHQLMIGTTLEDLAGNNIGKPFEVDVFESVQRRLSNTTIKRPFEIR